jgi:drug/metabolite transporter (DMT)-like permease
MVLIGSSTAPSARYVVRELPTAIIPLVRFGLSGLILLPFVWRSEALRKMIRHDWPRLLITAACCVPINQTFFLNGAKLAPTTHVALIYAACPLVVLALATAVKQETFAVSRLLGVLASVLGLLIIAVGNLGDTTKTGQTVALGDLLLIGAVVSWGAYLTAGKPLISRYGSFPVLAATFLFGSLLDLPIALIGLPNLASLADVSTRAWISLAHLTFVVTILGLLFQNLALHKLDASQVATFGNLSPLLTMVWGHLLFGDRLTPVLAVGGAFIMLGLFSTNRSPRKPLTTRRIPVLK